VVHVQLALPQMPTGIVVYLNQRSNFHHHHRPHQMAVLMGLKLTALLRHRPPLIQEAMRIRITMVVVVAAQMEAQAVVAVAAMVIVAEEHMIQSLKVMTEVASIVVVKTRINNVGTDFGLL